MPAVHVSVFHDTRGPVRPPTFVQLLALAHELDTPLPPLLLDAVRNVPFRSSGDAETVGAENPSTQVVEFMPRPAAAFTTAPHPEQRHRTRERAAPPTRSTRSGRAAQDPARGEGKTESHLALAEATAHARMA